MLAASILVLLALCLSTLSQATTYVVRPDGTGDFPTIQAGIDLAVGGDVIVLTDGTFIGDGNRDVDFDGRAITVRSQSGNPELCIIDCEGDETHPHRGFNFHSGEDDAAVLEGVTITDGYLTQVGPDGAGGAIRSDSSSPTIKNCIIRGNRVSLVSGSGGGISCSNASPRIEECVIAENSASRGGGISCVGSNPIIYHCVMRGNSATAGGGLSSDGSSSPTIDSSTIAMNSAAYGGGISFGNGTITDCRIMGNRADSEGGGIRFGPNSTPVIQRCVITGNAGANGAGLASVGLLCSVVNCSISGNRASSQGGGLYCRDDADWSMERTIIWGNCGVWGEEAFLSGAGNSIDLACCAVDPAGIGGPGQVNYVSENLLTDPMFCAAESCENAPSEAGNYALDGSSPCLATSSPCGALIGALDLGCNLPTATEKSTWGRIKAGFRSLRCP